MASELRTLLAVLARRMSQAPEQTNEADPARIRLVPNRSPGPAGRDANSRLALVLRRRLAVVDLRGLVGLRGRGRRRLGVGLPVNGGRRVGRRGLVDLRLGRLGRRNGCGRTARGLVDLDVATAERLQAGVVTLLEPDPLPVVPAR